MTEDKTPDTTTPTTADLSKRLAACPRFRWLPGMADQEGLRFLGHDDGGWMSWCSVDSGGELSSPGPGSSRPDIDDPATLGALEFGLLAGLGAELKRSHDGWRIVRNCGSFLLEEADGSPATSRAHALVLAMESCGAEGQS